MRKLILTCDSCGQRMQVPRSALGRTGLCPSCGASVRINNDTTTAAAPPQKGTLPNRASWWREGGKTNDDAKRRFGEAVDLYYSGRFAEALAIFNGLSRDFPDNPDIQNGRVQCERALKRPGAGRRLALEDQSQRLKDAVLDTDTVKRVVLEKLVAGETEAIQLQAADIAARILGMYDGAQTLREEQEVPSEREQPGEPDVERKGEPHEHAHVHDAPFTISAFRGYTVAEAEETSEKEAESIAKDDDVASSDARHA